MIRARSLAIGHFKALTRHFTRVLEELVKDPSFRVRVRSIRWKDLELAATDEHYDCFILDVVTNNRALLLGQFVDFRNPSMRGFHNDYIAARMEPVLAKLGLTRDYASTIISLSVTQAPSVATSVYRTLTRDEAVGSGLLAAGSILDRTLERYEIDAVLLAGAEISGPSVAMVRAIEVLFRRHKPKTCLDLFSGTGALARVAIVNGATCVHCVESDHSLFAGRSSAAMTLLDERSAWLFKPRRHYDMVILDPFYDWSLRVVTEVMPRLARAVDYFALSVGYIYDASWLRLVRQEIETIAVVQGATRVGEHVALFGRFKSARQRV